MKQIFASIILIAVLNQTFSTALFMLGLNLKKAEVNAEICSKTHHPTLQCQGVCDLLNKLKQTQEEEKKALKQQVERDFSVFFSHTQIVHAPFSSISYFETLTENFTYISLVGGLWRNRILRPPAHC